MPSDFNNSISSLKIFSGSEPSWGGSNNQAPSPSEPTPPTPEPPAASDQFEVTGLSRSNASLSLSVLNVKTGQTSSVKGTSGGEANSWKIKLNDNSTFFLNPAFNINVIHTDSYFATADNAGILKGGRAIEFKSGDTVFFGVQGEAVYTFTLWMNPDGDNGDNGDSTGIGTSPGGGDNGSQDNTENPESGDNPGFDINVKGLEGGGGCDASGGLLGIAFIISMATMSLTTNKKQ
jgi:hypothetical protein